MAENKYRMQLLCCAGTGCKSSQSEIIIETIKKELQLKALTNEVQVVATGCFGFCEKGPVVKVLPDNTFYVNVKVADVRDIIEEHIVKGRQVKRLLYVDPKTNKQVSESSDMDFYQSQIRIALRNCGVINPENIDEAIARDAYQALGKCLSELKPEQVIDIMKKSGLRGRGGAGFPTGLKWEMASKSKNDVKFVVCNADEGDPGAFMDRSVFEGDPHSVLESMAICGYCIGANKGLIYVRAEYPLAIHRLKIAIKQAQEYGLLGRKNIRYKF